MYSGYAESLEATYRKGRVMAGVHQEISYQHELFPGDTIRIESARERGGRTEALLET